MSDDLVMRADQVIRGNNKATVVLSQAEAVALLARAEAAEAERDALKAAQIDAIRAALEAAVDAVHCECWTDGDQGGNATPELIAEQATTELAIRAIRDIDPAAIAAKLKGDGDDRLSK